MIQIIRGLFYTTSMLRNPDLGVHCLIIDHLLYGEYFCKIIIIIIRHDHWISGLYFKGSQLGFLFWLLSLTSTRKRKIFGFEPDNLFKRYNMRNIGAISNKV